MTGLQQFLRILLLEYDITVRLNLVAFESLGSARSPGLPRTIVALPGVIAREGLVLAARFA